MSLTHIKKILFKLYSKVLIDQNLTRQYCLDFGKNHFFFFFMYVYGEYVKNLSCTYNERYSLDISNRF